MDRTAHEPGYIKGYLPGVRENGAQYTHAALWSVLALALLGESVPYEAALPRPEDEMDTAAYLLSLVLCATDRHQLSRAVLRVIAGATSAEARRTANEADRLIGNGVLLAAVG